ncbi:hypothetical protein ACQEVG_17620 [Streptomyces sp. CA-135486]|uniref:hypothetical protein n=1 Tax=Streptomyces sp. CA-135486 TaxID=3240049 RepID=UPI003D93D45B
MIRPAIWRKLVTRTATAAAAALLAVACSTDLGPSSNPSSGTSSPPVPPARLTYALPDDPVRMLFPATGAETRWTQGLSVFGQQVARTVEAACARNGGIGLPEQTPLAFIPFSEIPDLDFLAQHGFGQSAEVPSPAASPAPPRSGSPTATRPCRAQGAAAARTVRDAYAPLQNRWFRELASLRRDPATVRASRTLPDCLAGHGFNVRDEDGFFGLVDSRLLTAAPADFPYVDRELGHAYAACMRPVEAVREPARLRLRTRFLAAHADQAHELRKTLIPSLRRAEQRHSLRLCFPAP